MNRANRTTILVIEDDESIRQSLLDLLELHGFRVVVASDGTEGLAAAKSELPGLIITDLQMPGLTGFDLLKDLRGDETMRTIPVIVISARTDRNATRLAMELGAADFISKPFSEGEVIPAINIQLEKRELLDEVDAFAHTVAHDLKSPLAILAGRLQLIEMTLGTADEQAMRHNLTEANVAASRLGRIIDELLLLAGVRRQRAVLEPLDMKTIVAESLDGLETLIQRSRARVITPAVWPVAIGYPPWVAHVWTNYLSNAVKYAGPEAQITLGSVTRSDNSAVRFWVQDRGPGLDPAARAVLFVPFTRLSTVHAKGQGLGLSIVRRIVEKLGGQVGVESTPGAGAQFWFELPASMRPTEASRP